MPADTTQIRGEAALCGLLPYEFGDGILGVEFGDGRIVVGGHGERSDVVVERIGAGRRSMFGHAW